MDRLCLARVPTVSFVVAILRATACQPAGTAASGATGSVAAPDPKNASYAIEKLTVTLASGRAEREAAPGSAAKVITTLGDQRATGDVDGDGRPDTAVILVQQPGGSGTFYYVAALLNAPGGIVATPAVLLGDRITVSGLRIDGRTTLIDRLDRAAGQPLTASPSVAGTKRFAVDRRALLPQ